MKYNFQIHSKIPIASFLLLWTLCFTVNADIHINPENSAPSGRLIDVGGYKLHIHCLGEVNQNPTVIFDSGVGGFSLEWIRIQKTLSEQGQICAYDRAGYGWSDMGPMPRTTKRIVTELHTLLTNSHITGPYIFVGHSFGGYTAQYFARNYQDEIAGMVLVDSSHPEQNQRLPFRGNDPARLSRRAVGTYRMSMPRMAGNYPQEVINIAYHLMMSWKSKLTYREEIASLPISGRQVITSEPMPDIPLVILTRGQRVWPHNEYGNAMEESWMQLQSELLLLSSNAEHVIAKNSGHMIHLDQPGVVIKVVRGLMNLINHRKLKSDG